jgi:hypothetical protein
MNKDDHIQQLSNIDDIYSYVQKISSIHYETAKLARSKAKKLCKKDKAKHAKCCSIARIHENIYDELITISFNLFDHISEDHQSKLDSEIPF